MPGGNIKLIFLKIIVIYSKITLLNKYNWGVMAYHGELIVCFIISNLAKSTGYKFLSYPKLIGGQRNSNNPIMFRWLKDRTKSIKNRKRTQNICFLLWLNNLYAKFSLSLFNFNCFIFLHIPHSNNGHLVRKNNLTIIRIGNKIILTNGFIKKTNKTPKGEIEKAIKYKTDYERRYGKWVI